MLDSQSDVLNEVSEKQIMRFVTTQSQSSESRISRSVADSSKMAESDLRLMSLKSAGRMERR